MSEITDEDREDQAEMTKRCAEFDALFKARFKISGADIAEHDDEEMKVIYSAALWGYYKGAGRASVH